MTQIDVETENGIAQKRYGEFRLYAGDLKDKLPQVRALFDFMQLAVVRCEHLYASDVFQYVGLSPIFEVANSSMEIQIYELEVTGEGDDMTVEISKAKDPRFPQPVQFVEDDDAA